MPLLPGKSVPSLTVETLAHGRFVLSASPAESFTLIVVYRGLHCPLCKMYLADLAGLEGEFEKRGVTCLALSSDDRDHARAMSVALGNPALRMGFGLSLASARAWGLYISAGRGKTSVGVEEPALFVEPGVFIVRPDNTLYYASVQTMPFARPQFKELLMAIDYAISKNYPARGEYASAV